jgi:adenylate cyclase
MVQAVAEQAALQIRADEERIDHLKRLLQMAGSLYVLPLFLLFSIADYLWYPNEFYVFLTVRISTVLCVVLLNLLVRRQNTLYRVQIWSSFFIASCVWPLHLMVYLTKDAGTPYYAGLILIVVGLAGGVRFTWPFYILNISQTILPFAAIGLIFKGFSLSNFFPLNLLFLISIAIIMSVSRWFNEKLHVRELELRALLEGEIFNRDGIIQRKTGEALKLHSLSKQFSPQIISSLQNGKLSLDGKVHRSEICAVFVDIVGSTEKFISLDPDDLQKILAMYMDDVMGTFLKYDITIDKFLGDGVLGFSNDPAQHQDYIERVIRAALEIKNKMKLRQQEYSLLWLAEFEVSIGIATGFASVGFYGSDRHVKSYTAIGRVVNLAARLCAFAGPSEMIVSQELVAKLNKKDAKLLEEIKFSDRGAGILKGFESEKIHLYNVEVSESHQSRPVVIQDAEECPHGHGLLYLDQDINNIYFFKCRFCDYVLTGEAQVDEIKRSAS